MAKLVLAHYSPSYPLSLDNADPAADIYATHLLYPYPGAATPSGASAYGGLLRDRPQTTAVKASTTALTWQEQNAKIEVLAAQAGGIDGFLVEIQTHLAADPVLHRQFAVMTAASNVGSFYTIPMIDCQAMLGTSDANIAAMLNECWAFTSTHKVGTAFTFSARHAELFSIYRWLNIISLTTQSVYFVPCFDDYNYATSTEYDGVADGHSFWGWRNPAANATGTGTGTQKWMATTVQSHGKIWMQPVSVQDERPSENVYDEAANTTSLRQTWQIAIEGTADWVMLASWNEYEQGAQIGPSQNNLSAYLDLCGYYIQWYKTAVQPPIAKDVVYLTHRLHATSVSSFTSGQTGRQLLRAGSTAATNQVEALVFLTAAATVKINVNGSVTSFSPGAGITAYTATLATGYVVAEIVRSSTTIASVISPVTVTATPAVQDLQYYATSTTRGTVAPSSATTTPTTETSTTGSTTLTIGPGDLARVLVDPGVAAGPGLAVDGSQRGYGNLTGVKLGNGKGLLVWTENDLDTGADCLVRIQPVIPATDVTGVDDVTSIITNYLGGAILQRYLIDNPSYLALFTADPTALGSTTNEVVGGSYARLLCTWSGPGTKTSGLGALRFLNLPACTVTHIGVMDALTGGHMLIAKALPAPIPILSSAELRLGANSIVVTL